MKLSDHICVDCAALPDHEQPRTPRPAYHGGPRSKRCASHFRARQKVQRAEAAEKRVQRVYGLEPGEYERLLAFQGGTCAFPRCKATGRRRRLAVDHDHDTGEPRGLLCYPHNFDLLGKYVKDLQDALDYLADPPARQYRRGRAA